MTYTQLIQSLKDWTENNEATFVGELDLIVELAEKRILRESDLNHTRKYSTASLAAGDEFLSKPTEAIVIRSLQSVDSSNDRTFLLQKDKSFLDDYITDRDATGTPRYYAHWDYDTLYIVPSPAASTNFEISYTYRPTGLSSSTATTWISTEAPDALFYACLIEASIFMKEAPDLTQSYTVKYQEALQRLLVEENLRNRDDEYRTRSLKLGDT
jgi:hypothetical protein